MSRARLAMALGVLTCSTGPSRVNGQGLVIPTAGPINSSMAGASTAAPIDFGSSYWNPATISGLDRQEFLLGSALILPSIHLQTTLPAGSVGGRFPTTNRSGTSRSNSGVASNLATGTAFRLSDDSPWTFGLGIFGLVGGGVNFAGSSTQPLLTPRNPPRTFGVGPIYSNLSMLEITPIASYQATDKLAIAAGPIITSTGASFAPAFFAPNPRDGFGLAGFPNATNSRPFWGGGFQAGLLYNLNEDWNLGFSYKSPICQERWSYNAAAQNGSARCIGVQAGLPEILSWGVAYKGLPKTLIDVDLRYFDYKDAPLFGQSVSDGGLGWRSVFAVATGVQYQLTEKLTLRGGYLYNTNPIPSTATLFNVQAPGITQHTLSLGVVLSAHRRTSPPRPPGSTGSATRSGRGRAVARRVGPAGHPDRLARVRPEHPVRRVEEGRARAGPGGYAVYDARPAGPDQASRTPAPPTGAVAPASGEASPDDDPAARRPRSSSAPCLLLAGGCFGPATVRQTRDRYNEAIRETNNEELLLNLVRLRYNEHPSFLPVTGLNAQFALNAGAQYRGGPERGRMTTSATGRSGYADRPTLTFGPQRPPELTKALLTQVSLDTLYLFTRQAGDIERVLRLFVRRMNGIENATSGGGPVPRDPPQFGEFRMVSEMLGPWKGGDRILTIETGVADLPEIHPGRRSSTRATSSRSRRRGTGSGRPSSARAIN